MRKNTPQNASNHRSFNFPPPLWLLVDDKPKREIFPRIGNFMHSMEWEGGKSFRDRVVAQPGVVHEHPYLRVAWSGTGDLAELKKLLDGGPKALVLMDLNFDEADKGPKHGLELVKQLLEIPEIRDNCVFLLKTTSESADADKFRRENISYLRILRSLYGNEAVERIQFLGANANQNASKDKSIESNSGGYESKLIGNLLLGLQEEAYVDGLLSGSLSAVGCNAAIDHIQECDFYGLFRNSRNLKKLYVNQFLKAAFDDRKFPSYRDAAINVGVIEQIAEQNRGVSRKKALLTTCANDSHAMEMALLRYGVVAEMEAPLFTMSEHDEKLPDHVKTITRQVVNQKWSPSKRKSFKYISLGDILGALEILDEIVSESLKREEDISTYQDIRLGFDLDPLLHASMLHSAITLTKLRGFIKNHCTSAGYCLAAPALSRLESWFALSSPSLAQRGPKNDTRDLYVDRGLNVVSVARDHYFSEAKNAQSKKVNLRIKHGQKVYVALNRENIAHNFVQAERLMQIAGEEAKASDVIAALKLDAQCGSALQRAAFLAVNDPEQFVVLVKKMENTRVPLGLPEPQKIEKLFSVDESSQPHDISYFLGSESDGGFAPLIELVVAGMHVLKYHIECFLRNMEWNSELDKPKKRDETEKVVFETLAVVWAPRGWDDLFVPELPAGVRDPLEGAWGRSANLLKSLENSSQVAVAVSNSWKEWLSHREIVKSESPNFGLRSKYKNEEIPEGWLRLLWLGLPLDYAAELTRQVQIARGCKTEGTDGLDNLSAESDAADLDEDDGAEEDFVEKFDVVSESEADEADFENEPATLPSEIRSMKKRDGGNPKPTWKMLNTRLSQKGSEFTIREPLNEYEWDDAFTADVVEAVKILKADS